MNPERLRSISIVVVAVLVTVLFLSMIKGFWITLLLAAIFAGVSYPVYSRFLIWFRNRRGPAAAVTLTLVILVIVVPLLLLLGIVAGQALKVSQSVAPWVQEQIQNPNQLESRLADLPFFEGLAPYRDTILQKVGEVVAGLGNYIVQALSATTKGTISFFFQLFIMLYAMFFFLIDGEALLKRILFYLPLDSAAETRLTSHFVAVTKATIKGTLVIGLIQGVLGGAGLAVAGIPSVVFWGAIIVVLSIIPGIGAGLVWMPVCIYLLLTGQPLAAGLLALWFILIVGSVDNFLRPALVGRDTKMPDLLILLGTLGGIVLFGVSGILIGPIVAALFLTVWEIYGEVFKDKLPSISSSGTGT